MVKVKRIIDKYSFIGSIGIIIAFFLSSIGAVTLNDINQELLYSCIVFMILFYVKSIVKNKFDLLRYSNRYYSIGELIVLIIIFIMLPIINTVLSSINIADNISGSSLLIKGIGTIISFNILFILYNGYNLKSCKKLILSLLLCVFLNIVVCLGAYSMSSPFSKVIYIITIYNISAYMIPIVFFGY